MSGETILNQLQTDQIPAISGSDSFPKSVQAMQRDLIKFGGIVIQPKSANLFPSAPVDGGLLITVKGIYEAIFTDDLEPLPRWRRIANGDIFAPGDPIPVTL